MLVYERGLVALMKICHESLTGMSEMGLDAFIWLWAL